MKDLTLATLGARTAPLGVRFWDTTSASFVGDGLRVTAYPVADPRRRSSARPNASRVWVFHELAGMGKVQRGEGDAAFWASPPALRAYVLDVDDELGRFVPFQLSVNAPVRGLLPWSPPAGLAFVGLPPNAVPLFPSATRAVPQGMGVIRADLWDPDAPTPPGLKGPGGPAAWALVTATVDGLANVRGIADAQGRVALIFAYPGPLGGGSSGLTGVPLTKQTWPVTLEVRYAPAVGKAPARAKLPDVLTQASGSLWQTWDANPAARQKLAPTTLMLKYEMPLAVATTAGPPGGVLYTTQGP